ncbi:hypothetical protein P170DRAFT_409749 [Aspergillus steynii IBT 23096]|uniref:Uncharacterized protein n=1 Tax=Aspergillus steynii IBT 23096 TaxID=1392250 RepID=A0A2I2G3X8_9EURO|nr:uncharacterized protein P170DRAFT_409749 [Aspergillus steynii IBT 23096]PLB47571.1 hypothetical protein P170DRAFT_409749 [Aspergillus steynii IBT 23096]
MDPIESSEEYKILHTLVHYPEARVAGYVNQLIDQCHMAMAIHAPRLEHGVGCVDANLFLALTELVQVLDPSKHDKLVQFVHELEKRTVLHPDTGKVLEFQGSAFFTDLPGLGWSELEAWDMRGGSWHDVTDPDMDPKEQDRWVNLNAFVAQLTQASELREPFHDPLQVHRTDRSLRAIWVMVEALENSRRPLRELVKSAAVRAACMWFIYAADRLLTKVDIQVRYPEHFGAEPGSRYPEKKWTGHELDRWMEWMQNLGGLKNGCVEPRTLGLLMKAQDRMFEVMIQSPPCDVHIDLKGGKPVILLPRDSVD